MAFTRLESYSETALPRTGSYDDYTICENVANYKPYDVSSLRNMVESSFNTLEENSKEAITNVKDGVNQLADDWGAKYISINKSGIDIVKVETFTPYLKDVAKEIEKEKEKCLKLIDLIIRGTETIETYIEAVSSNNQAYENAKSDLNKAETNLSTAQANLYAEQQKPQPNQSTIFGLNSNINTYINQVKDLKNKIQRYENSRIPEPDGQWVVG